MATTSYGQEGFAHYHVLQTESARDMPTVDIGYYRLADARHYVDDMLKSILRRALKVQPDDTFMKVEQVIGNIRKDWRVQIIGISAWRDLIKGHIIPREACYGPANLDNTYYEIKRCRSIGCKPELLGEMTKNQTKYISWYDRAMGFDPTDCTDMLEAVDLEEIDLSEPIEVEVSAEDIERALGLISDPSEATTEVVMHGNDMSLGHYY